MEDGDGRRKLRRIKNQQGAQVPQLIKRLECAGREKKDKRRWTETGKRQEANDFRKGNTKEKWQEETKVIEIPREGILQKMDG